MPTVSESSVALRFLGGELDPNNITTVLGVEPTIGRAKGTRYRTPIGAERTSRTGMWHRDAPRSEPANLDEQIAFVLAGATQDLVVWQDLCTRYQAEVYCGLHLHGWNEALDISPASLHLLGERGLRLGLDIYADPED
jgi:hypothetical protein